MFIPTINTGGREVPFSTPLGREAKSLMGYPLSFYEGVQKNKQTNKQTIWTIIGLETSQPKTTYPTNINTWDMDNDHLWVCL